MLRELLLAPSTRTTLSALQQCLMWGWLASSAPPSPSRHNPWRFLRCVWICVIAIAGAQSGPNMAVTSIGVTAPGLAVPALWVASQQPAVLAGALSAGPPLHTFLASGVTPRCGATGPPLVQSPQLAVALWSTIAPIVSPIGGPPPSASAGYPIPQMQLGRRCSCLNLQRCSHNLQQLFKR